MTGTPMIFPAVNSSARRWQRCCCSSLISCFWTSRQRAWTPSSSRSLPRFCKALLRPWSHALSWSAMILSSVPGMRTAARCFLTATSSPSGCPRDFFLGQQLLYHCGQPHGASVSCPQAVTAEDVDRGLRRGVCRARPELPDETPPDCRHRQQESPTDVQARSCRGGGSCWRCAVRLRAAVLLLCAVYRAAI